MGDQQYWANNTYGGYYSNSKLSAELRHALVPMMRFRQFCDIKESFGGGGVPIVFDKLSKVSTAGGTLVETDTIPEHRYTIGRGTITVSEWGNSIPYTGKLEALSKWDVTNPTMRILRNDMAEVLDKAAGLEFKKTGRKYVCLTTATGTLESIADGKTLASGAALIAKSNLRTYHIDQIVNELKRRDIPKYDGENYICIASVNAVSALRNETQWLDAAKYGDPSRLFSGEIGRYRGVRFLEETNYLVNTFGSSTGTDALGEAVFFGAETVIEGIAVPEEVRYKIPTDYGRSKGLAWYGILGWEKMWKHTDSGQDAHIIHVCSTK